MNYLMIFDVGFFKVEDVDWYVSLVIGVLVVIEGLVFD